MSVRPGSRVAWRACAFAGDLRAVVRHRDFRRLFAHPAGLAGRRRRVPGRARQPVLLLAGEADVRDAASRPRSRPCCCPTRWSARSPACCSTAGGAGRSWSWPTCCAPSMVLGVAALVCGGRDRRDRSTPRCSACLSVNRFFLAGLSARPAARRRTATSWSWPTRVSTTDAARSSRSRGGGIGFGAQAAASATGAPADAPGASCVAALGYASPPCSRLGWTATCSGPTSRPSRRRPGGGTPRGRAAWSTARSTCGRTGAGRARAGRDRRAPLLLRHLDHLGDPAVPQLLQRPGRRRRRAAPGWRGVRRVGARLLPGRRDHAGGRPSGCASRPGSTICFAIAAVAEAVFVVCPAASGCCSSAPSCSASPPRVEDLRRHDRAGRPSTTPTAAGCSRSTTCIFNVAFVSAAAFGAVALPADGNSRAGLRRGRRRLRGHRRPLRPGHQAPHHPHRRPRRRPRKRTPADTTSTPARG